MKKINVLETFSGIGAQHQALENLKNKIEYEIIGTSDWDVFAVQSYASIHCKDELAKMDDPSEKELNEFINSYNKTYSFSMDGKKPLESFQRISENQFIEWYKAFKATKNIGSVVNSFDRVKEMIEKKGEKIDLLTYSFPCQDLSSAGNFHGFNEGIKKHTRSGLLYEIEDLIKKLNKFKFEKGKVIKTSDNKNLLPKYLLLENVLNLVQKTHRNDFDKWLSELNNLGYKNIWGKINANDFGMLQARRRVFVLSVYDPENKLKWENKNNESLAEELKKIFNNNEYRPKIQSHSKVFDFEEKYSEESFICQIKNTPSRIKMIERGQGISPNYNGKISTVTTKQDRWPNVGNLDVKKIREAGNDGINYTGKRFITPREAYKLMGFTDKEYTNAQNKMKDVCVSDVNARDKLYKQAGNSIAVNVLEMIFFYITKLEREMENDN